jgi:hypothetical protein
MIEPDGGHTSKQIGIPMKTCNSSDTFSTSSGTSPPIELRDFSDDAPVKGGGKVVPIRSESMGGRQAERALFQLLVEMESVGKLIAADFKVDWIPSTELHPIYEWAIRQYQTSGSVPSLAMFRATTMPGLRETRSMYDVLAEYDIDVECASDEPPEWVIEDLRNRYLQKLAQDLSKRLARDLMEAPPHKFLETFSKWGADLTDLAEKMGGSSVGRKMVLTPLTDIPMMATRWLWDGRISLGSLSLLAGREGVGKSTVAYTLAAQVTNGTLEGHYLGQPRAVIIAATEDSFAKTIVPRLVAAKADLAKVFRVDVKADGMVSSIDLPADLRALEHQVVTNDVALILIDPLTSRLSETLDTHKDSDVRQALEPIVGLAERTECVALGIIHVNKSSGSDAGNLIMGSRAFNAVARSTMMALAHPEESELRILAMAKNNLGRMDLPALIYRINQADLGKDANGEQVRTSSIEFVGEDNRYISDIIEAAAHKKSTSVLELATLWLESYLTTRDGSALVSEIKPDAKAAGITSATLRRAKEDLGLEDVRLPGKPPRYEWKLAESP